MSIAACAELVRRAYPDSFSSAMTAAPADRPALFILYAFDMEIARATWETSEPMIAEMRLQWWQDVITAIYAGDAAPRHEVATPLADLIREKSLNQDVFAALITARRWNIYKDPHTDQAAFDRYTMATFGGLMWLTAQALGADAKFQQAVMDYGYSAGVARLLCAVFAFDAVQKPLLVDKTPEGIARLASNALDKMRIARGELVELPKPVFAALRNGWKAEYILKTLIKTPDCKKALAIDCAQLSNKVRLMWKFLRHSF